MIVFLLYWGAQYYTQNSRWTSPMLTREDGWPQSADNSWHTAPSEAVWQCSTQCPLSLRSFSVKIVCSQTAPRISWCISLKREIFLLPPFAHHEIIPSAILQYGKIPLMFMLIVSVLLPLQTCWGCALPQHPGHGWHVKQYWPQYFPLCKSLVITMF